MSEPLVSVVICAYNVDRYIEKCVRSVMNQTYDNIQIICVDDYSTDQTRDILLQLAKSDPRIHVLCMSSNGGRSEARNAGIDVATGEFVSFIDGDDEIKLNTYERVIPLFKKNIDVVWFGLDIIYESHENMRKSDEDYYGIKQSGRRVINPEDVLDYDCSCCNKIFRRSQLVSDLRFSGRYYEDALFFMKFFSSPRLVYFVKDRLYVYYRHPVSIMADTMKKKEGLSLHHLYILDELFQYWTKKKILPEYNGIFNRVFAAYFWFAYRYALPYERSKVIYEATKRLRAWNTGQYEDPLLEDLRDGKYEVLFQLPAPKQLSLLQKIFCIRNEKGRKVIRLFNMKIISWKKVSV